MVIVMIGIMAAIAYPRLSNSGFDEGGYREQVIASLSYARKAAVAQRRNVRVTLSNNSLNFLIANDIPEGPNGLNFAPANARNLVLPGSTSSQISPRGNSALAGPPTLTFSPLGVASSSTSAYVYTITGAQARTFQVDPVSGYVY